MIHIKAAVCQCKSKNITFQNGKLRMSGNIRVCRKSKDGASTRNVWISVY